MIRIMSDEALRASPVTPQGNPFPELESLLRRPPRPVMTTIQLTADDFSTSVYRKRKYTLFFVDSYTWETQWKNIIAVYPNFILLDCVDFSNMFLGLWRINTIKIKQFAEGNYLLVPIRMDEKNKVHLLGAPFPEKKNSILVRMNTLIHVATYIGGNLVPQRGEYFARLTARLEKVGSVALLQDFEQELSRLTDEFCMSSLEVTV